MSLTSKTVEGFLDELASSSPAPGGGSVSALAGSLSGALTAMVAQLTIGKKKYADVEEEMKRITAEAESLRKILSGLVNRDTEAFNDLMKAFGLPKETDEQKSIRAQSIEAATKEATKIPLDVMKTCHAILPLVDVIAAKGNANAISDAGVAALLALAGCRGAYYNVSINLGSIRDKPFAEAARFTAVKLLEECESTARRIQQQVEAKLTA